MGWTQLASGGQAFTSATAGYAYNLAGGAPPGGCVEVLFISTGITVSSVTTVTGMPWILAQSSVQDAGSYLYYRLTNGVEGSTAKITSSQDGFSGSLQFMRWSGANTLSALDVSNRLDSANVTGTSSPSVSSGSLVGTGELVCAFAGLFNEGTSSSPTLTGWSTGLTDAGNGPAWQWDATHNKGSATFAAYDTNAGTSALTAQASWTWTSSAGDLDTAVIAFKPASSAGRSILPLGQNGFGGGNATGPTTIPYDSSTGSTLVLTGYLFNNSNGHSDYPVSVTDSAGNTWQVSTTTAANPPTDQVNLGGNQLVTTFIAWCINASAVASVTVSRQDNAFMDWWRINVSEWSGVGAVDDANIADTLSSVTSFNQPSLNLTDTGDLVVAVNAAINGSPTKPAGYTNLQNAFGGAGYAAAAYNWPGSTGAHAPAWTGTSGPWSGCAVAFKPTGVSPTSPSLTMVGFP